MQTTQFSKLGIIIFGKTKQVKVAFIFKMLVGKKIQENGNFKEVWTKAANFKSCKVVDRNKNENELF